MNRRSPRAGFTLVEVLLTLLILSGIMLSITQILTAARTSRDTIHNIQETQQAGPAILDLVERDLRGLFVYGRTRQAHLRIRNRVMLGMDGDSIDLVTSTDSLTPVAVEDRWVRGDVNEAGYRLRPAAGSGDQFLEIYRREGFGVDDDPFEGGVFQFLHDRVKGFDVQAFANDGPDEQPLEEWGSDRAQENVGLPARIEITLTLELAPRLINEQLSYLPKDRRTLVYKRIVRPSETLRATEQDLAVPAVPAAPAPPTGQAGAGAGGGTPAATAVGGSATGRPKPPRGAGGGGQGGGRPGGGAGGGGDQPLPH